MLKIIKNKSLSKINKKIKKLKSINEVIIKNVDVVNDTYIFEIEVYNVVQKLFGGPKNGNQ